MPRCLLGISPLSPKSLRCWAFRQRVECTATRVSLAYRENPAACATPSITPSGPAHTGAVEQSSPGPTQSSISPLPRAKLAVREVTARWQVYGPCGVLVRRYGEFVARPGERARAGGAVLPRHLIMPRVDLRDRRAAAQGTCSALRSTSTPLARQVRQRMQP